MLMESSPFAVLPARLRKLCSSNRECRSSYRRRHDRSPNNSAPCYYSHCGTNCHTPRTMLSRPDLCPLSSVPRSNDYSQSLLRYDTPAHGDSNYVQLHLR